MNESPLFPRVPVIHDGVPHRLLSGDMGVRIDADADAEVGDFVEITGEYEPTWFGVLAVDVRNGVWLYKRLYAGQQHRIKDRKHLERLIKDGNQPTLCHHRTASP